MSEPKRPPGIKFVGEIPAGSDWRFVGGRLVIAGPSHAPYFLNDDGSKETLSMARAPKNEMVDRVSFEMQRYELEGPADDGSFFIVDGYRSVKVREGLTADDEPIDIVDGMNARAAIAAMREPTVAMRQAGEKALDGIRGAWPEEAWRAMIDEAAKP